MAITRTTVAIRQDFKQQLDQMQRTFEKKLDLPEASLSPQVFLYGAASLGVRLLEAVDAAKEVRAKVPGRNGSQEHPLRCMYRLQSVKGRHDGTRVHGRIGNRLCSPERNGFLGRLGRSWWPGVPMVAVLRP